MSVEFVEPDPAGPSVRPPTSAGDPEPPAHPAAGPGNAAPPQPPRWRRWVAVVWLAAAALLGVAPFTSAYEFRQTAFVQDFDGTHPVVTSQPVDGFGHVTALTAVPRGLSISASPAPAYGAVWLAAAIGLLLATGVTVWRPAGWTTALAAVFGAVVAGALATLALSLDQLGFAVPNLRTEALPATGFWIAAAGAGLALVGALAVASAPSVGRRFGELRRVRDVRRGRGRPVLSP